MVDNPRIRHAYFVDMANPEYNAPYDQHFNIPRFYTPDDKAIQRPSSETGEMMKYRSLLIRAHQLIE